MKLAALVDDIFRKHHYATADDVRNTFGDYHNVLHWLTSFLMGEGGSSDQYIVDAGSLSKMATPEFHDWLVQWAARATVRNVLQSQRERIAELALEYEKSSPAHQDHTPLSVEQFQALIRNSEKIHADLDVLCRFVLVIRGIAREPVEEVAAQLGISCTAAEGAYCVAFDALRCE